MIQQDDTKCLTFPCGDKAVIGISIGDFIKVAYCEQHWQLAKSEYEDQQAAYKVDWISSSVASEAQG